MVIAEFDDNFKKLFSKLKDPHVKEKTIKQIEKLKDNPEIGKPMQYGRKRTKEVYLGSVHLSYAYIKEENKIIFLDLYHKDEQ